MMNGIKMDSHITQILNKQVDYIQHKRAKQIANGVLDKQARIISKIKVLPPGALQTEKKYKRIKDEYHHLLMQERYEHLNSYKTNLMQNLSKKSLMSQAS